MAIMDDLRGRLMRPGDQTNRRRIGDQFDVDNRGIAQNIVRIVGIFAGDRLDENTLGQARCAALVEFLGRHDLATRNARDIGHQALDLGNAMFVEPFDQIDHISLG